MSRKVSSRGEDPRQSSTSTKNRIFGMDLEEEIPAMTRMKNLENAEKQAMVEALKDLEVADNNETSYRDGQGDVQDEKKDEEKVTSKDLNPGGLRKFSHNIRYSSFMDEDSSNQSRIQEQKLQQKQWLDQQIAERKSIDRKHKKTEDLAQESNEKYDAYSSSKSDRIAVEKREMQNEIREYNENMAKQKRARDKQEKEMDKREWNESHNNDLRKDDQRKRNEEEKKREMSQMDNEGKADDN